MKHTIYLLSVVFGMIRCNNQPTEKSLYDQSFIDGLSEYNEPIKLIDNFMLIGNDTTYFPDDLILDKVYIFEGHHDSKKYKLTVTRINQTNLKFNFQLFEKNKLFHTETGEAILPSLFFLGPEGEPDTVTGDSFFSTEYLKKDSSIWLCINIGMDKDYKGNQRAKITYHYTDESKQTANLEECPILRSE